MTKVEKTAFDELKHELAIAKALRFTEFVEPDVPVPDLSANRVNGWSFYIYQGVNVKKSCSSSVHHHVGDWDKTSSQRPITQYSTRLLALRAGRAKLEMDCAKLLADVDAEIEKESKVTP